MTITQFANGLKKKKSEFDEWKNANKNNFNVFNALGLGRKENYHSLFIAYLLDKDKKHYKNIFAREFFKKLKKTFLA